ncbi:protein FAM136A-like [Dysidea avara]|uniref:protein FAM136A-like n=1 Tax=Dysidea avara TaxID=196820 RepID=UPI0033225C1C
MSDFAEQISRVVDKELEDVEKHCIRPLQVEAFQCCKECCTDQTSSHEKVTHCMQRCMKPVQETEQLVSSELEHFQTRLTRCSEQCGDEARDSNKTGADVEQMYKNCLQGCVDKHVDLVPTVMARIKKNFKTC